MFDSFILCKVWCNDRHPDPWCLWQGGPVSQLMPQDPTDPAHVPNHWFHGTKPKLFTNRYLVLFNQKNVFHGDYLCAVLE